MTLPTSSAELVGGAVDWPVWFAPGRQQLLRPFIDQGFDFFRNQKQHQRNDDDGQHHGAITDTEQLGQRKPSQVGTVKEHCISAYGLAKQVNTEQNTQDEHDGVQFAGCQANQ